MTLPLVPPPPFYVMLLGDSHAGGLTSPLRELVLAAGGKLLSAHRDGLPTSGLLGGVPSQAELDKAGLVILVTGTNDSPWKDRADYPELVGNVARLYAGPHRRVAFWGPPVLYRPDLVDLPAWVVDRAAPAAKRVGALYVDSRPYTGRSGDYDRTGVHPTRGYARWAKGAWAETIEKLSAVSRQPSAQGSILPLVALGGALGLAILLDRN